MIKGLAANPPPSEAFPAPSGSLVCVYGYERVRVAASMRRDY